MNCVIENFDNYNLLIVEGSVSNDSLDYFKEYMEIIFSQKKNVIVDISKVNFICSSCLSVLFSYTNRFDKEFKVLYYGPNAALRNLFKITGLDRKFHFYSDFDEAISNLEA